MLQLLKDTYSYIEEPEEITTAEYKICFYIHS
jgi:hypothetical protein